MRKGFNNIFFLILLTITIGCKKKFNASGSLKDLNGQPQIGVLIKLNQCTDSRDECVSYVVESATTDQNGEFAMTGKYKKKGRLYLSYTVKGVGYHINLSNPDRNDISLIVP